MGSILRCLEQKFFGKYARFNNIIVETLFIKNFVIGCIYEKAAQPKYR